MSTTDVVQVLLALSLPPLLLAHVLLTRAVAVLVPQFIASYGLVLALYWSYAPALALQQLFAVIVVWVHGAIGIYSRLVLLPSWRRIGGIILPILFAVPILALLGFVHAGNEVLHRLAMDEQWRQGIEADIGKAQAVLPQLAEIQRLALLTYAALAGAAVIVLLARLGQGRNRRLAVAYDDGSVGIGRRGLTILEISTLNDIPHAHVCSGRARCGTCRVEVEAGAEQLSSMTETEHDTLAHVHAAAPGVRLACQARVLGPGVSVRRLLPAFADASARRTPEEWEAEPAVPAQEAAS
jgi:adenylate cyclase